MVARLCAPVRWCAVAMIALAPWAVWGVCLIDGLSSPVAAGQYLKFFRYFWTYNAFLFAILALVLLSAIYFVRACRRRPRVALPRARPLGTHAIACARLLDAFTPWLTSFSPPLQRALARVAVVYWL